MKRVLCFVITFVITLLPLSVFADATATEIPAEPAEILFRGMPWDINPEDFEPTLARDAKSAGGEWLGMWADPLFNSFSAYGKEAPQHEKFYQLGTKCYMYVGMDMNNKFFVAGLPIEHINAYAIPKTITDTNLQNCTLVLASYQFSLTLIKDHKAVVDDLRAKLIQLYGEPAEDTVGNETLFTRSFYCIWYGANDTFCQLKGSWNSDDTVSLELRYGKTDIAEKIEGLKVTPDAIINDLSGL